MFRRSWIFISCDTRGFLAISSFGISWRSDVCFLAIVTDTLCSQLFAPSTILSCHVCMDFTCIFQLIVELECLPTMVLLMLRRLRLSDLLSLRISLCSYNLNSQLNSYLTSFDSFTHSFNNTHVSHAYTYCYWPLLCSIVCDKWQPI